MVYDILTLLPFDVRCLIYKEEHMNYTNTVIKDLFNILQWDDTKFCYVEDLSDDYGCFQIRRYDTTKHKWMYVYNTYDEKSVNIYRIIQHGKVIYKALDIEIPQHY